MVWVIGTYVEDYDFDIGCLWSLTTYFYVLHRYLYETRFYTLSSLVRDKEGNQVWVPLPPQCIRNPGVYSSGAANGGRGSEIGCILQF